MVPHLSQRQVVLQIEFALEPAPEQPVPEEDQLSSEVVSPSSEQTLPMPNEAGPRNAIGYTFHQVSECRTAATLLNTDSLSRDIHEEAVQKQKSHPETA